MTSAYLNRNARAVPEHEVQEVLVVFAEKTLADPRLHSAFGRMQVAPTLRIAIWCLRRGGELLGRSANWDSTCYSPGGFRRSWAARYMRAS